MNAKIPAKLHLGDQKLPYDIIPQGVKALGDWAYAHCSTLAWIALPSSLEQLGRDVFLGCDNLQQVYLFGESAFSGPFSPEHPSYLPACLNAMTIRFFSDPLPLLFAAQIPAPESLRMWDDACLSFCMRPSDQDFRPFLAGGEEDYTEGEDQYDAHLRKQNHIRARMLYLRLLSEKVSSFLLTDDQKERFFSLFRTNPEALSLLSRIDSHYYETAELYREAGLLSPETLPAVIESLPPSRIEMKSALLSFQSGGILETLSL